jgi:hypothetical protein
MQSRIHGTGDDGGLSIAEPWRDQRSWSSPSVVMTALPELRGEHDFLYAEFRRSPCVQVVRTSEHAWFRHSNSERQAVSPPHRASEPDLLFTEFSCGGRRAVRLHVAKAVQRTGPILSIHPEQTIITVGPEEGEFTHRDLRLRVLRNESPFQNLMLKIHAQDADMRVLRGARRTIERCRPSSYARSEFHKRRPAPARSAARKTLRIWLD